MRDVDRRVRARDSENTLVARAVLPHVYQVAGADGARHHYLDLNWGELEFLEDQLVVRIFGTEGLAMESAWDLDALGASGDACVPVQGALPAWRHGLSVALWVASLLSVLLAPLVLALWAGYRVLRRALS